MKPARLSIMERKQAPAIPAKITIEILNRDSLNRQTRRQRKSESREPIVRMNMGKGLSRLRERVDSFGRALDLQVIAPEIELLTRIMTRPVFLFVIPKQCWYLRVVR